MEHGVRILTYKIMCVIICVDKQIELAGHMYI